MLSIVTFASREKQPDGGKPIDVPRAEYPRPQFVRKAWMCLNGSWDFEIDRDRDGLDRGLLERPLNSSIIVPFAPESKLSGVGVTDFLDSVWYRRSVAIPGEWEGMRTLLHFQAVDYDATVWVNGIEVGRHRGGFTPFSFDITGLVGTDGSTEIVVRATDTAVDPQPRGKQSTRRGNYEAFYPRTTGIWQTVWLEPVPPTYLGRPRITPEGNKGFRFEFPVIGDAADARIEVTVADEVGVVATGTVDASATIGATAYVEIPEARRRLWTTADPHLYTIDFRLSQDSEILDEVRSYGGLRTISIRGKQILINGQPQFQRLVLDQGWYPDGLMTAPTDEALVRDIRLALDAGFNGARLHQKVFEERYLYHADRLGYLVWGEFGDWGMRRTRHTAQTPSTTFVTQWLEAVERDYSHPAIVGWCPLNETFEPLEDRYTELDDETQGMYLATKALDRTRPVIDASGYSHRVPNADVYDSHSYEQDPVTFAQQMAGLAEGDPYVNVAEDGTRWSVPYANQPYFCSEYGGMRWAVGSVEADSWGYGEAPASIDAWLARFEGLTAVLRDNPDMFGYCFTQLTDVFQEENGIYTFDRREKFDLRRVRDAQAAPAAYELEQFTSHVFREVNQEE